MTCRRAFEADLLTLVRGEGDAELRVHVEGCADCAAELEVWRELDGLLQVGATAPTAHPAPEDLVAFVDAPASIAADVRAAIERHVAACRPCADEVRALASFAPAVVAAPSASATASPSASTSSPAAAGAAPSAGGAPRGTRDDVDRGEHATAPPGELAAPRSRGGLVGILWHPAFAYALVVLLLVPLVRDQLPELRHETRAVDPRRDAPLLPAADGERAPKAIAPAAPAPPSRDAAGTAAAPGFIASAPPAALPAQAPPAAGREPAASDAALARKSNAEHDAVARVPADVLAKRAAEPGLHDRAGEARQQTVETEAARPPSAEAPLEAAADRNEQRESTGQAEGYSGRLGIALAPAVGVGRASGAAAPPASATAPAVLDLRPGTPTIFAAEALGRAVQLRVMPPADLARGAVTVTVRGRANRRELTIAATNHANAIVVDIPADWLVAGDYTVTLQPAADATGAAGAPALLGFTVRAPTRER